MVVEEQQNGGDNTESGAGPKRPRKIRDLLTDRIVGIVSGAAIPLVLLFVPLVNKYLDNSKEIQTLQIKENAEDITETKTRLTALTSVIIAAQIQIQTLSTKLLECERKYPPGPQPTKAPG